MVILLLAAGTPALLVALDAAPWRQGWSEITTLLTNPDDGRLALLVVACAAWIAWAVMAWLFAVEIIATLRGAPTLRLPGLGVPQEYVGQLVAAAALLFTVGPAIAPSFAATPVHATPDVGTPAATLPAGDVATAADADSALPTAAEPVPAQDTVAYTVRRGDSLWKIAEEHLGDGLRYREIVYLNKDVLHGEPDFIDPGLVLRLPRSVDDDPGAVDTDDTYVVEPGDTLWEVAEAELGDGARFVEIFEASTHTVQPDGEQLSDPSLIHPGWELTVPSQNGHSPVVEPPVESKSPVVKPPVEDNSPVVEPPVESKSPVVDKDGSDQSWLLPGLVGAGALLAGGAFAAVRAHRRTQLRHRRPGFTIAPPPEHLRRVEKTITVSGAATADVIDQLDRLLRHLAACTAEAPPVAAIELASDTVTLHLADPCELPAPWSGDTVRWSAPLIPSPPDEDVIPPYPLLASVGQSDDGHLWLLNLEQAASVALVGDCERATALARHLAAELALSPWSTLVSVEVLGLARELADLDELRLRHHGDDPDFLGDLLADLTEAQATGTGDPEPYVLLLAPEERDPRIRDLTDLVLGQNSRSGLAVVQVGAGEATDVILDLTGDGRLRVPSLNLDLAAAGLTADEAAACASLVNLTRDITPTPVPRAEPSAPLGALADQAGALIEDVTDPRPPGEAGPTSLLPEEAQRYEAVAATTAADIEQLAPRVPEETRRKVLETDPQLDEDLAAWLDPHSPLPKLHLLGPVTFAAPAEAPHSVQERRAYYTELIAFLALHPSGVSSRQICEAFGVSASRARTDVGHLRRWLGTSARTGEDHLPKATTAPAHTDRGTSGYQLHDVLVDFDLFRRLRARGQARGCEGMTDLVTALDLVTGEPFTALRRAGWTWLLDDERLHETATLAVVDVSHVVVTDALSRGDIAGARRAAEIGCLAAPYDEICRLDLAKVAETDGHETLAGRILREHVFDRSDDYLAPVDLSERTEAVRGQG
ncbi:LysM peptidoglycan-binding domain-containing protein [Nocardioides daphniae]|uniref:LysM peptidoglycan-binding domain-containing protein n=1 Tax=Nocardioides daphniae TaxID=402297 RepID=UPI00166909BB